MSALIREMRLDLDTITHARIRLAQGDLRGARAIVLEILARDPSRADAKQLLSELRVRRERPVENEPDDSLEPPRTTSVEGLRERFRRQFGRPRARRVEDAKSRIVRLRRWLARVGREDGSHGAP